MQVIHPVCCGINVHAAQLMACLRRVSDDGQITTELVDGGTTSRALLAFRTWLHEQQCPVVAMERTGVSWKPVSHVLSDTVEVCVAHSHEVRQRLGTKADESDATWMAALLAMHIHIKGAAKALDKCDRSRLDFSPLDTSFDRLVHVILTDRGANDRMDRSGEILGRGHPIPQRDRH